VAEPSNEADIREQIDRAAPLRDAFAEFIGRDPDESMLKSEADPVKSRQTALIWANRDRNHLLIPAEREAFRKEHGLSE
jgi:hypothetical protein